MGHLRAVIWAVVLSVGLSPEVLAQAVRDVDLGNGASARYRTPAGPMSNVAFLIVHRTSDYRDHAAAIELRARSFATLGIRTRFRDSASVVWDRIAIDVRNGVRFLRAQPGITKVILIGHSGGGPTVSFYQAVAEAGPAYCRDARRLSRCTLGDGDVTRQDGADAVILIDAHVSNGANLLRRLYPSVATLAGCAELNAIAVDGGCYSATFVDAYARAQSRRMNGLITTAQRIQREIARGTRDPTDNRLPVHGLGPRLSELDATILDRTSRPVKLLKDDSSIVTQFVGSTRVVEPNVGEEDRGTEWHTATSFLSAFAIRSGHALDSLDWCSSNNSVPCAVARISVPVLVIAAQGHYFVRDGEVIHDMAASSDKNFLVVEGLTHRLEDCLDCIGNPTVRASDNLWAYVVGWTAVRLLR